MKETFITKKFKPQSLEIIDTANAIIERYWHKGYSLTLRQIYYQFVSKHGLENNIQSYNRIKSVMTDARMAGLVDWDAIEDRTRNVSEPLIEEDPGASLQGAEYGIAYDYWYRQDTYVEVWVEKEALADVIRKACYPYRVPYLSCRGYLSASEAYTAGKRYEAAGFNYSKRVIIHLGDHDPSGIDMTRDNRERVHLFSDDRNIDVRRIALNMDQIDEHQPPPNFVKVTDSRSDDYRAKFGDDSWELDALEPDLIVSIIQDEIRSLIDQDEWDKTREEELSKREELSALSDNWDDISEYIKELFL